MGTTYQQVLDLLTNSPGNLFYHVILALTIFGALQAALNLMRGDELPQDRRMLLGLGLLLGVRLLLFLTAAIANSGVSDPHLVLPNADRTVMILSLVIIIWLWLFPKPIHFVDAVCGFLSIFILFTLFLSQLWWGANHEDMAYNLSFASTGWEIFAIVILVLSIFLFFIRKPNGWGYGVAMVCIMSIGHLVQLIFPDSSSDYPGGVRLFELAAYPLLWSIPNRFAVQITRHETIEGLAAVNGFRRQVKIDPKIFLTILSLTDETTPKTTHQKLAKLLTETFLAEKSLLILPPDEDRQFKVQCGYDMTTSDYLPPLSFDEKKTPMLSSAMDQSRPLRLPASSKSEDIVNIPEILGLDKGRNILAAFVPSHEGEKPLMGIVLISPDSGQHWSRDDQAFLNKIASSLSGALMHTGQVEKIQKDMNISEDNLLNLQQQLKETKTKKDELENELKKIKENSSQNSNVEIANLLKKMKLLQGTINRLEVENTKVEEETISGEPTTPGRTQLQEELKLALTEVAHLVNLLSDADQKGEVFEEADEVPNRKFVGKSEDLASIVRDLRRPMSSIIGYTDLLLTESAGILGTLQRKFLERIQLSTERMEVLIDDLFQVGTAEIDGQILQTSSVDLGIVFDGAIEQTRTQFQENGIVIKVDLPDEMPRLIADKGALQQIMIHLLRNAGSASPTDGEILLRASSIRTDEMKEYLLMQVADQGGGIPNEDIPRVFSGLEQEDDEEIQGIGEPGIGLSLVKALVEAHNGRIWIDTEMGIGSTFSVIIPMPEGSIQPKKSKTEGEILE